MSMGEILGTAQVQSAVGMIRRASPFWCDAEALADFARLTSTKISIPCRRKHSRWQLKSVNTRPRRRAKTPDGVPRTCKGQSDVRWLMPIRWLMPTQRANDVLRGSRASCSRPNSASPIGADLRRRLALPKLRGSSSPVS